MNTRDENQNNIKTTEENRRENPGDFLTSSSLNGMMTAPGGAQT